MSGYKKTSLVSLLLAASLALSGFHAEFTTPAAWSWGTVEHPILAKQAIELLPEPWKPFFKFYDWLIAQASVYPDSTYLDKDGDLEQQKHYIDLEIWSPSKPSSGTLAFAVEQFVNEMVESLKKGDWDRALVLAGRVSHYVADIHQPYHATKNFWPVTADGEALHSTLDRWIRNNPDKAKFITSYPVTPIQNLTSYIFQIAWQSNSYLPKFNNTLLSAGRNQTRGTGWTPELHDIMVNRTNTAIISMARVWYTAFLRSGINPPGPPLNTALRVTMLTPTEFQSGALDPEKRYDIRFEVRDALGVRVAADVVANVGEIQVTVFPGPGEVEPHGKFVVTIFPGQLRSLQGQAARLKITASAKGYSPGTAETALLIGGGSPERPTQFASINQITYLVIAAAVIAIIFVTAIVRKRRAA